MDSHAASATHTLLFNNSKMERTRMASLLMLLSRGAKQQSQKKPVAAAGGGGGLFECKTCNRRFPTFQALGGHRTSHRRPRVGGDGCNHQLRQTPKPKLHACPVCGLAFLMGQALGGHMRRHKLAAAPDLYAEKKHGLARELLWLDLNLPPLEDELQLRSVGAELGFLNEETAMHSFSSCSSPATP